MMLYMIVPHRSRTHDECRFFTSFALAEQAVLGSARGYEEAGDDPDWCYLLAYEGLDELRPIFLYTLVGSSHLRREPYPTASP